MRTDQSGRVEEVGNPLNLQSPHIGSDPTAVLQLAHRKLLTLQQMKLNVPRRQSLERKRQAVFYMGTFIMLKWCPELTSLAQYNGYATRMFAYV